MKLKLIAVIVITIFVSGCMGVSTGSKAVMQSTEASVATQITKGVTTKDQVAKIFGRPSNTQFTDSGLLIWNYIAMDYGLLNTLSGKDKQRNLNIIFNENDIVKNYSLGGSK